MSGVWSPGIGHMDGNEDSIDDWRELMLSPRGLFPSSVSDPCLARLGSNVPIGGGSALEADFQKGFDDSLLKCKDEFEVHENGLSNGVGTDNVAVKTGGSIAERRAAKFGFDTLKINTSRFKSGGALASPAARSPFILRTPGISPSALLESPIMLPNLQPSPTTGAFAFTHIGPEVGMDRMFNSAQIKEENDKSSNDNSSFTFKPHNESISSLRYSSSQNQHPCTVTHNLGVKNDFQCSVATQPPMTVGFEFPTQFPSEATSTKLSAFGSRPESNISRDMVVKASSSESQPACSIGGADIEMQQNNRSTHGEDKGIIDQTFDGDQKFSNLAVNTSEDGYNWRKYGQKQVKGSEFPRSYFKCTHPNCPVKKKVEHAPDGQVTEIIYKGSHNHEKPQPNKRSTFSSAASCGDSSDVSEGGGSAKAEGGAVWRNSQHDNLERTCSTSIANGVSDPSLATEAKPVGFIESAGTPEISSTLASNGEDEEEDATQANLRADDEDAEPDMKRRKLEEGASVEAALGSRAVREPRVIVQIESEVDILDDGYRWRKYGQKVVKGNPNPRSYYKCTFPGCTVRKHVERASHNLKCVLTTYEGKHNHEVPTARNSSHSSSGSGSGNSVSAPAPPKPEPQDLAPHPTQKLEFDNRDFMRPNYLNNFAGAPPIYQMKLPAMPNAMLYGAFRGNLTPEMPPQMRFPVSSNLSIPSYPTREPRLAPVQPIFLGRQPEDGDLTALRQAK